MCKRNKKLKTGKVWLAVFVVLVLSNFLFAFKMKTEKSSLELKEFRVDELYISQSNIPLDQIINQLINKEEWEKFTAANKGGTVFIDPRSGRAVSITYVIPLLPGTGVNNDMTLEKLSKLLGYKITEVNKNVVREVASKFIEKNAALLNINPREIREIKVENTASYLWQVFITRQVDNVPVRDSNIVLTINHGNLVLWGIEKWGDVNLNLTPAIDRDEALKIGFSYVGGQLPSDKLISRPHLEIIPVEPHWDGTVGKGYEHKLVWQFIFKREGYPNTWEMLVDAHKGKLISFQDLNQYITKKIVGSIYPVSDDGCCPDGCAIDQTPMPFTNTGFGSPNDYTNLGGFYSYASGTAQTSLYGKYTNIYDFCGTINETSTTGDIDLGGTNGQHDCTVPAGHSAGDTYAARSGEAELTLINRTARGWVNYAWLDSSLPANMNIQSTCNAFWDGTSVNFYRSGGGCRNTGEIAAVFDHEWGHGIDDNDTNGNISSPGEAIADIVSTMRLHNSCVGRGFFWTINLGCGQWTTCPSDPGTSYGYKCGGYGDCCTACTGVRDSDYALHASGTPHTPANFICVKCGGGSGPCGKEVHCENAPTAEAAWDLAARDLQSAPYSYDKQTAFEIATRTVYLGSGSVTSWYTCSCPSTSNGCGATNGYMQWITADDDNGNINDGTPHMTAIYNAFNRHGIACSSPTPQDSGCAGGPTSAPTVSATPANNSVALSWTSVSGASQYYVFRTEGLGCDFGKVKLATVATTSYTDTQALNGRTYYYAVQPVGSSEACLGPLSNCVSAVPVPCSSCAAYMPGSATITNITGGDGDAYPDNCETATATVSIQNIGTGTAQSTEVTITAADPFITITTPMPINVGDIPVNGTVNATFNFTVGQGSNQASCKQAGNFNISVQAVGQTPAATDSFSFMFEADITTGNITWAFEPSTGLEGWTVQQGTWALSSARVNPGGSTRSVHSSEYLNGQCDVMLSPEIEATVASTLTIPNWYAIEPFSSGSWWDRSNVHIVNVQNNQRTLIIPTGKPYQSGTFYDWGGTCQIGAEQGWAGDTTGNYWGNSNFDLSSFNGQKIKIEIRYMTDPYVNREGVYVDDIVANNVKYSICDTQSDTCAAACSLQPLNNMKPSVDDTGSPTANNLFEPNETASLLATLQNTGAGIASSISATLTTTDTTITINQPNASYADINPGSSQTCSTCYSLTPQLNRPSTHWDFTVSENVSASTCGPYSFDYTYHVGESFSDVPPSYVFYKFIETLLHNSVAGGCTSSTYCPLNNVQRQAMAKFICTSMNVESPGSCPTSACSNIFSDVPASNSFCPYIEALYNLGIVGGCQNNPLMYCPNSLTQRQAMAKFICLGMNAAAPGSCPTAACAQIFSDVPSSNSFCSYIEALYNASVISGCQTNPLMYCPNDNVSRAQMAKFLVNAFNLQL